MSTARAIIYSFNRGIISSLAMARVTAEDKASGRIRLSGEEHKNLMPRVLGSMMLRPGGAYLFGTLNNKKAIYVPFIFATDDLAKLEFTDLNMRIVVDDAILTRVSVSSAITNGTFDSDIANWSDSSGAGASTKWVSGGYAGLTGTDVESAVLRSGAVTVISADQNKVHGIRVKINRGVVRVKVGSSAGSSDYFDVTITEGEHSLAFTPTGDFHVEVSSSRKYETLLDFITVESSGDITLTSPYAEADLSLIRWDQSADVIFLGTNGYRQYKIERRGDTSWSLVKYYVDDGPFRIQNLSKTTISSSGLSGDITLTASDSIFKSTNVGGLFKLGSVGQQVTAAITGAGQFTDAISVSGVGNTRDVTLTITGTWVATITLQRSEDEGTTFSDVTEYTGNQAGITYNDTLDNQELQYRIGSDTGDFTSGTATVTLDYATGSLTGIARLTGFTSATVVSAIVLKELGGTAASQDWSESDWSDRRKFPTACKIYESRLGWAGRGKFWASETDSYEDFDPDAVGDAGPINRRIGSGPVDNINWMYSGARLVLGSDGAEVTTRQSFDEILTPSNFGFKKPDGVGSARINNAEIDKDLLFVGKSGTKIHRLKYDSANFDYIDSDLMELIPDLGKSLILRVATQKEPDKRVHAVLGDGNVAVMVNEPAEEVSCWILYETDGVVEDVVVLPGSVEDQVYYTVKRIINGATVRYHEKWSLESECQGGTLTKLLDSHLVVSQTSSTTISGLTHLEAEVVTVWGGGAVISTTAVVTSGQITGLTAQANTTVVIQSAGVDIGDIHLVSSTGIIENDDLKIIEGLTVTIRETGKGLGTYTVSSGAITVSEAVTDAVVGLPYKGRWKSVKLAYGSAVKGGNTLTDLKRVDHVGVILRNTHYQGLKYGSDFENLFTIPRVTGAKRAADDTIYKTLDVPSFPFKGKFDADSRVCLQAESPNPCTILGLKVAMEAHER